MWLNTHLIFACICISSPHSLNAEAACHFHRTWTSALVNCEQSRRDFGSILQSLSHFLAVLDKMFNEPMKLTGVWETFGSWLRCSVLWWALARPAWTLGPGCFAVVGDTSQNHSELFLQWALPLGWSLHLLLAGPPGEQPPGMPSCLWGACLQSGPLPSMSLLLGSDLTFQLVWQQATWLIKT